MKRKRILRLNKSQNIEREYSIFSRLQQQSAARVLFG